MPINQEAVHFFVDSTGPNPGGFYDSNFAHLQRRAALSSWPHPVQQGIFESLRQHAQQQGAAFELVHHPLDNTLQGILLPELSAGAFGFDPDSPQVRGAGMLAPQEGLAAYRESTAAARKAFSQAREVHNGQERIYLEHMDFSAADKLCEGLVRRLMGNKSGTRPGREIHRFFGAATAQGNLDYVPQAMAGIECRIYIKGRPGTGKSTLLKRVAAAALRRGYDVEVYHCALDVGSLDMVAVRGLGFCLLDSTAPHEYFPQREGDEILDMYARCVVPGTDEAHAGELNKLEGDYKQLVKEATGHLREAGEALARLYDAQPQPDPAAIEEETERLKAVLFG